MYARASTSTRKFRSIVSPKLCICILSSKFPLDGSLKGVSSLLRSLDFGYQQLPTGHPPIQTLAAVDADLNFRHVQPTRVLGRVVKLHPAQELCGRALTQHIVEALPEVSIEVVQHQVDSARLGASTGE